METVRLKNGTEEAEPMVKFMMASLRSLMTSDPIPFYELVMKCRDREHQFFGNSADVLKKLRLVEADGSVHDSIRNIVNSAVVGDDLDMRLVNPVEGH